MFEVPDQTSRIAELEADNRRLRILLDQRDAPGELRHRLRSTMAMLRTIIRRTADTERDFDSYVSHLEDRMDALMRAQAAADERGSVDFHDLLADELLHYGVLEPERALLSGPSVELQPRAGQVLAMAIHELVINAIEHGDLDAPQGRLEVTWTVSEAESPPVLTFVWKERDGPRNAGSAQNGFGTEVLTQLLGYELKADTNLDLEEDGFRYTARIPLSPTTGVLAGNPGAV